MSLLNTSLLYQHLPRWFLKLKTSGSLKTISVAKPLFSLVEREKKRKIDASDFEDISEEY